MVGLSIKTLTSAPVGRIKEERRAVVTAAKRFPKKKRKKKRSRKRIVSNVFKSSLDCVVLRFNFWNYYEYMHYMLEAQKEQTKEEKGKREENLFLWEEGRKKVNKILLSLKRE